LQGRETAAFGKYSLLGGQHESNDKLNSIKSYDHEIESQEIAEEPDGESNDVKSISESLLGDESSSAADANDPNKDDSGDDEDDDDDDDDDVPQRHERDSSGDELDSPEAGNTAAVNTSNISASNASVRSSGGGLDEWVNDDDTGYVVLPVSEEEFDGIERVGYQSLPHYYTLHIYTHYTHTHTLHTHTHRTHTLHTFTRTTHIHTH
jgi:hypothetical protein